MGVTPTRGRQHEDMLIGSLSINLRAIETLRYGIVPHSVSLLCYGIVPSLKGPNVCEFRLMGSLPLRDNDKH